MQLLSVMVFGATATLTIHRSTSTANLMKLTHLLKNVRLVVMNCAVQQAAIEYRQDRVYLDDNQAAATNVYRTKSECRGIHYFFNQWRTECLF